jgi:hypothetical protein
MKRRPYSIPVVAAHGGSLRHWIKVPGDGVAFCGFAPKDSRMGTSRGWLSYALAKMEKRVLGTCGTCNERKDVRQ